MSGKNKQVVFGIGDVDPDEYVIQFKEAVIEAMLLIFERRALDLEEGQMHALFLLAHAAKAAKVISIP